MGLIGFARERIWIRKGKEEGKGRRVEGAVEAEKATRRSRTARGLTTVTDRVESGLTWLDAQRVFLFQRGQTKHTSTPPGRAQLTFCGGGIRNPPGSPKKKEKKKGRVQISQTLLSSMSTPKQQNRLQHEDLPEREKSPCESVRSSVVIGFRPVGTQ